MKVTGYLKLWPVQVEEALVVVHPSLGHTCSVEAVGVLVARERVGVEGAEDVAHSGARDGLQRASTHPHLVPHAHKHILLSYTKTCICTLKLQHF